MIEFFWNGFPDMNCSDPTGELFKSFSERTRCVYVEFLPDSNLVRWYGNILAVEERPWWQVFSEGLCNEKAF
jgi:hypothetical protein